MYESDVFYAPCFEPDEFRQRVADEMGLDNALLDKLTCTKFWGDGYRIDLSLGKHHAFAWQPELSVGTAREVANAFLSLAKKWVAESKEQAEWDKKWEEKGRPSSWDEFASWVDEYMQIKEGWVVSEVMTNDRMVKVEPTMLECLYDLLHFRRPKMREKIENGSKLVGIKVKDKHGETIACTPYAFDALCALDGVDVVRVGKKLKHFLER